jgi:ribosomal protein S18 acetylase RimI-like enzyme
MPLSASSENQHAKHGACRFYPLRLAVMSDLPQLLALEALCFEVYRRDTIRLIAATVRDPRREVWVVESLEGHLVAALVLRFPHRHTRIYSIAVDPQWRGSGLGRLLLDRSLASTRERHLTVVRLEVEAARSDLVEWYERNGFVRKKLLPDFYGLNRPALQMQKNL